MMKERGMSYSIQVCEVDGSRTGKPSWLIEFVAWGDNGIWLWVKMCDWGRVVLISFHVGILRYRGVSGEEWIESIEKTACLFDGLFRSIDQITINSLLECVVGIVIWTTLERKGWWRPVEVRVEDDGNRNAEQIEQRWVLLWFSKVQFEHVHVLDGITAFDINVLLFSYPISFRESPLASDDFLGVEYVNEVSLECRIIVSSSSIVRKRSSGIYTTNTNIYVHSSLNIIYIIIHLWKMW